MTRRRVELYGFRWLILAAAIAASSIPGLRADRGTPQTLFSGPDATVATMLNSATGSFSLQDRINRAFATLPAGSKVLIRLRAGDLNDQLVAQISAYLAWPLISLIQEDPVGAGSMSLELPPTGFQAAIFIGEVPTTAGSRRELAHDVTFVRF